MSKEWLVVRVDHHGPVSNEFYPRLSLGETAEDAIENMFGCSFEPASRKDFVCFPVESGTRVSVKPRGNRLYFYKEV